MGKKLLSILLVLALIIPGTIFGVNIPKPQKGKDDIIFRDIKGHWNQEKINEWKDYKIIEGNGKGQFMPDTFIKRGDLAIMIDRMIGYDLGAVNVYSDLPNNAYYASALLKLVAAEVIDGGTKNLLRPEDFATREEVAEIIAKAFHLLDDSKTKALNFRDKSLVNWFKKPYVEKIVELGYMKGYPGNSFKPKGNITRAELIKIFDNIFEGYYSEVSKNYNDKTIFKNDIKGNAMFNMPSVSIELTDISKNLYLSGQGSKSAKISRSKIGGKVFLMGSGGSIELVESSIKYLTVVRPNDIKGVENIDIIHIKRSASGSSITGVPKHLIVDPYTSLSIEGELYKNETSRKKTFKYSEIKNELSLLGKGVKGAPEVLEGGFQVNYDGTVTAKSISIKNEGEGEVDEVGVLIAEDTKIPNINDYKHRVTIKSRTSNIPSKKLIDSSIDANIGTLYHSEGLRTYIVYAKNSKGLVGYGKAQQLRGYEFSNNLSVFKTGDKSLTVELVLNGKAIPEVGEVVAKTKETSLYSSPIKDTPMSVEPSLSSYTIDKDTKYASGTIVYRGKLTLNTAENFPEQVGYAIRYAKSGFGEFFPVLNNPSYDEYKPVSAMKLDSIVRKDANTAEGRGYIQSNYNSIKRYGIAYIEAPLNGAYNGTVGGPGWEFKYANGGNSLGTNSRADFKLDLPRKDSTKAIYAVVFVDTASGFVFDKTIKMLLPEKGNINTDGVPVMVELPLVESITKFNSFVRIGIIGNSIGLSADLISLKDSKGEDLLKWQSPGATNPKVIVVEEIAGNPVKYVNLQVDHYRGVGNIKANIRLKNSAGQSSDIIEITIPRSSQEVVSSIEYLTYADFNSKVKATTENPEQRYLELKTLVKNSNQLGYRVSLYTDSGGFPTVGLSAVNFNGHLFDTPDTYGSTDIWRVRHPISGGGLTNGVSYVDSTPISPEFAGKYFFTVLDLYKYTGNGIERENGLWIPYKVIRGPQGGTFIMGTFETIVYDYIQTATRTSFTKP